MSKFKIDLSQIKKLPEEIHRAMKNGMTMATEKLRDFTMQEAPRSPAANLLKHIVGDVQEEGQKIKGTVVVNPRSETGASYAVFVAEGTGLYGPKKKLILPKKGKFLVFKGRDDDFVFLRSSKGMKPNPFHERALQKCAPLLPGEIEKGLATL